MREIKHFHVCVILAFAISTFISFAAVGRSICEFDRKPGESLAGVNGPVYAMIKWAPSDGEEPMLVVGGGNYTTIRTKSYYMN